MSSFFSKAINFCYIDYEYLPNARLRRSKFIGNNWNVKHEMPFSTNHEQYAFRSILWSLFERHCPSSHVSDSRVWQQNRMTILPSPTLDTLTPFWRSSDNSSAKAMFSFVLSNPTVSVISISFLTNDSTTFFCSFDVVVLNITRIFKSISCPEIWKNMIFFVENSTNFLYCCLLS